MEPINGKRRLELWYVNSDPWLFTDHLLYIWERGLGLQMIQIVVCDSESIFLVERAGRQIEADPMYSARSCCWRLRCVKDHTSRLGNEGHSLQN